MRPRNLTIKDTTNDEVSYRWARTLFFEKIRQTFHRLEVSEAVEDILIQSPDKLTRQFVRLCIRMRKIICRQAGMSGY